MTERVSSNAFWHRYGPRLLPFADAATNELPLRRILRLALFQVGAGMTFVLLNGTLNRVMIVELGVIASLVSLMIALPLLLAPLRALIGFRSDHYVSYLGWRRVPFLFIGSMLQFGGLAILPFALILLSGDTHWPVWFAKTAAAFAFLLVGIGMHTVQTAGLALATDIAPEHNRVRVVAFLYVMLLVGMVVSSIVFSLLLDNFSQLKLIQVVQGVAVVILILNLAAAWAQEPRQQSVTRHTRQRPGFWGSLSTYVGDPRTRRFLCALAMGTAAFSMQDILLEPYGGQVLGLDVSATTLLTAVLVGGTLFGFALAARSKQISEDPCRIAAYGATLGLFAFSAVIFASPFSSTLLFTVGTFFIGAGVGLFSVSMLAAEMLRHHGGVNAGLALGAWGAVQASAAGIAIAMGGVLRDVVSRIAASGGLGPTLEVVDTGYLAVYMVEIVLLFVTLVILGPLAGKYRNTHEQKKVFGLIAFPG